MTSARSWARVRASSGPWRARAAAVVRSQIPAAVSAGRWAESQAMPSRSGTNSTRRSAALLVWRSSMPAGWWRSRQARALARNRDGTSSPAGQPRAGFGAPGSRKCASSAAAPAASRAAVSSTMIRACCPGDRPGLKGRQGQRQRRRQGPGFGEEGRGGAFADGQDTGDLGHQGHLLDGTVPRGRRRRRQEPGCVRVVGGQPHPQRRGPGLQPGDLGEPVQATVRQPPQRIAVSQRVGSRRIGSLAARSGQGSKRGNRRGDGLHGRPALRSSTLSCSPHSDHLRRHRQK